MANVNIKEVVGGAKTIFSTLDALELDDGTTSTYILLKDIFKLQPGEMWNGWISPTVTSNNLTVEILTLARSTPSSSDPVIVNINGTIRTITAATSFTLAAATNWGNAGSAELATKEIDWFPYLVWDSNSSVVALSASRIPCGNIVSDFSATTTNEKHLVNYANFTSTDDVVNIGRFAATLSAGAGYTWTVPTYTNANLIHHPIFETRTLSWTPQHTRSGGAYSNLPTTALAEYQIIGRNMKLLEIHGQDATPGSSGYQRLTVPFTNPLNKAPVILASNNTTGVQMSAYYKTSSNILEMYLYDGTVQATGSQNYLVNGLLRIG